MAERLGERSFRKGVLGYDQQGPVVDGVTGTVVLSRTGQVFGIGLTRYAASVGNTASGVSTTTEFFSLVTTQTDGRLDPGDTFTFCSWFNSAGTIDDSGCVVAGAQVVDCAMVPARP